MRARNVRSRADLAHRDSSLVVPYEPALLDRRLITPASVHGLVVATGEADGLDATATFRRRLAGPGFGEHLGRWLTIAAIRTAGHPTFFVETEVRGETGVQRRALADLVRGEVARRYPRWVEARRGDVRLLCKADPYAALLGVQLYTNLRADGGARAGALREHLACSLLVLARVSRGDAVVDPFAGTGTILRAARERCAAGVCIGAEVDQEALLLARHALGSADAYLHLGSFDELDARKLPSRLKLVSNLPFGVRFDQVPTARLYRFIARLGDRLDGIALLMDRRQARELGDMLQVRIKNVLVLGQPAGIVYSATRPVDA